MRLDEHPEFAELKRPDPALKNLEVGDCLIYPRQFRYNVNGNNKYGTQTITAPFGLAPGDVGFLLWLVDHWMNLDEKPEDGQRQLPLSFIAQKMGLSKIRKLEDRVRIGSRVFRAAHAQYTSTAFWYPQSRTHDIANFGFFSIRSMSSLLTPRRAVVLQLDPTFIEILNNCKVSLFHWETYRKLSSEIDRRWYLHANQQGYVSKDSVIYAAQDFAVHQLGMMDSDLQKLAELRKTNPQAKLADTDRRDRQRRSKLKEAAIRLEADGIIQPRTDWGGYLQIANQGAFKGQEVIAWRRGPAIVAKSGAASRATDPLDDDPLFEQVKVVHDQLGEEVARGTYQNWIKTYGRRRIQKHVSVVLAQMQRKDMPFAKSPVHTLVDRMKKDYGNPDWFQEQEKKDQLVLFDTELSPSAQQLCETIIC